MILNRIKKLIVITLCALFVLPLLNLSVNSVNAAEYDHTKSIYLGVNYVYNISKDDIKNAKIDDITIFAKNSNEADDKYVEIFKDKSDASDLDKFKVSYLTGHSSQDAKVTIMIRALGDFDVKVQAVKKEGDTEKKVTHVSKFTVTDNFSKEELTPKYTNLYTFSNGEKAESDALTKYKDSVKSNIKKNNNQILAGDDYTIPKLDTLISTLVPYENLKKTLYYASPNGTTYSTKTFTKADGTFTISSYGTYRFYVTLYVEKFDKFEDGITVDTTGLEEKEDGFYRIKDVNGNDLYAKKQSNAWVYYVDEEFETKYEGEVASTANDNPIIPIFSFTLENKGPNVKISSAYQENGYKDLEYTLSGITISGNDVETKYTLQYKAKGAPETAWADAEEEFDSESLSFTPTKLGSYRVRIDAVDATGLSTPEPVYTKEIIVDEKYKTVDYKVSFGDWISVNAVPFIFLCISGACLIAIILLLVINPKEKVSNVKEEDR